MGRQPKASNRRPEAPIDPVDRMAAMLADVENKLGIQIAAPVAPIADDVTFRQWCEGLAAAGSLHVDGQPFSLDDRPAMAWIYDQVPSTREQAFRKVLTMRKCAQVGFTVMEMLIAIYFALKFNLKIGLFVPDASLAKSKSSRRFMAIVRRIPDAYDRLTGDRTSDGRPRGEGNVMSRTMGDSQLHFLWTSGKTTTESNPMDVVSFDEVQEMLISDMEKVQERLSASRFKFTLMGSTANWPDADIDYWYKKGSQHRFHTRCPTCEAEEPLDDYFPECIQFDENYPDRATGAPGDYRYVCKDGHWIDDPQHGTWIADNPEAEARKHVSVHFHQMLSPTISPREMIEAYRNADDRKNFFNRKLGKPYQDPSQIPVSLAHLNKCAADGVAAGVVWKTRAQNTFMGIDQMGAFNVVIIKERLPDGRQAVIHVEEIYSSDPFRRCDELVAAYGVRTCVVETLPNFNDAQRFAARHEGKVFLASYGDLENDLLRWGDGPTLDTSDRRTTEDARTRFTVKLDQYKCMQLSLGRLVAATCVFPDPLGLHQELIEKGMRQHMAILKGRVFLHFQRTALVTERVAADERKYRRKVVKVGIDPHFSYANMLCDVAYARAHGTATFLLPDVPMSMAAQPAATDEAAIFRSQLHPQVQRWMEPPLDTCGRCEAYQPHEAGQASRGGRCRHLDMLVSPKDPGCVDFVAGE